MGETAKNLLKTIYINIELPIIINLEIIYRANPFLT